jgi:hypothetical protein
MHTRTKTAGLYGVGVGVKLKLLPRFQPSPGKLCTNPMHMLLQLPSLQPCRNHPLNPQTAATSLLLKPYLRRRLSTHTRQQMLVA